MIELIKWSLEDFWRFIGFLILLATVLNFIFNMWNRFWRHWNIRKHGYPSNPNLDADGDFKPEKEEK